MRRTLTVLAATAALTAATLTPAAAHSGTAGPYKALSTCEQVRKKFIVENHVVSACQKSAKGYYFKYSH